MALRKLGGEPSFALRREIRHCLSLVHCLINGIDFKASLANLRFAARFLADFFTALIFSFFCIKTKEHQYRIGNVVASTYFLFVRKVAQKGPRKSIANMIAGLSLLLSIVAKLINKTVASGKANVLKMVSNKNGLLPSAGAHFY